MTSIIELATADEPKIITKDQIMRDAGIFLDATDREAAFSESAARGVIELAQAHEVAPEPPGKEGVAPTEAEVLAQLQWQEKTLWNEIIHLRNEINSRYDPCGHKRLTVASDKCAKCAPRIVTV